MLHLGHEDMPAVEPCLLRRDAIQSVCRPLDEDDDLVLVVHAEKLRDQLPGVLVSLGRQA